MRGRESGSGDEMESNEEFSRELFILALGIKKVNFGAS